MRANLSLPINGSGLWVHEGGFFLYPPLAEALEELKQGNNAIPSNSAIMTGWAMLRALISRKLTNWVTKTAHRPRATLRSWSEATILTSGVAPCFTQAFDHRRVAVVEETADPGVQGLNGFHVPWAQVEIEDV